MVGKRRFTLTLLLGVPALLWIIALLFRFRVVNIFDAYLMKFPGPLVVFGAMALCPLGALIEDLDANQINLTERVIDGPGQSLEPAEAIDAWVETRQSMVSRAEHLLAELQSHPNVDLSMLAVASRQLKAAIGA